MTSVETAPAAVAETVISEPARPQRRRGGSRAHRGISGWIVLIVMGVCGLLMVFPFWLAIVNAFKAPAEYVKSGPLAVPPALDFSAVIDFWTGTDFTGKLLNSVILSAGAAVIAVLISLISAYAIGIGRVKGRVWILAVFMIAFTIPQEAIVYPLFYLAQQVNLYDNLWGVVIIEAVLQSAFGIYMLSSVLGTFPAEVLEAARLDGASRFQILVRIVFPLTRPTLMVLLTFFFIWTWNDFFLPLILLPSDSNQTVSVAMGVLSGQYVSSPTGLAAASLVGMLPAIVFFLIFQRTLMRGVNLGSVK